MKQEHFEILLEDMRAKFELVFEGHEMLNNRLTHIATDLGQKIADVDSKLDRTAADLYQKLETLDAKVDRLAEKVEEHDRRFDAVDSRLAQLASELEAHRHDTEAHPKYLVAEE